MRRIIWIIATVLILGGVSLWSLHFFGQSQIDGRLDRVRAQAEARGWALTWGDRTAEGFPLVDSVRLTDVGLVSETGVLVKAGELVVAQDADVPGALRIRLPSAVDVSVPVGQVARQRTPVLPPRVDLTITTEDALLRAGTGEGGAITAILSAASLRAAIDQADFPVKLAVDAGTLMLESDPAETGRRFRLKAARFGLDLRDTSGPGTSVIDSRYVDLSIGATVRAPDLAAFLDGLGSMSEKLVDGEFQSASQAITVSVVQAGAPGGRPTTLTWKAGPQTGLFHLDKGTLGYSAEDRDIRAALDLPTAQGALAIRAGALFYQRQFELPIVTEGATPRAGSLRVALEDVLPDEATWALVDPNAALDREPADLLFDARATLRLVRGAGALPVEFSNVSLMALRLSALGAAVRAEGDVEILQPINLPLGEIEVGMSGVGALIGKLHGIGLLDDRMAETGRAILEVFARPAADGDRHETEIAFTRDGMLINGRTIDGRTPGTPPADALDPTRSRDDGAPAGGGDGPGPANDGAAPSPDATGDGDAVPGAGGGSDATGGSAAGDAPADASGSAGTPDEGASGATAPDGDASAEDGSDRPPADATTTNE